jgi:hypothetical protein
LRNFTFEEYGRIKSPGREYPMPLTVKQANDVADVMRRKLGAKTALELMEEMNEAAYGVKKDRPSLKSFKRIIKALEGSKKVER